MENINYPFIKEFDSSYKFKKQKKCNNNILSNTLSNKMEDKEKNKKFMNEFSIKNDPENFNTNKKINREEDLQVNSNNLKNKIISKRLSNYKSYSSHGKKTI